MKIVAINGSPQGENGNTNVMVNAFLKGAEDSGAETRSIFLSKKEIQHCKGCHTCWTKGPGQCVINDDMLEVLSHLGWANIIVFATPVYFANMSGMLKVFMDRMTMLGNPHSQRGGQKKQRVRTEQSEKLKATEPQLPKLMIISSCGFPDRDEFQVISLWIHKVAEKMHMELIGEIYATRGKFLGSPPEDLKSRTSDYLLLLEKAGAEVAKQMQISKKTEQELLEYSPE